MNEEKISEKQCRFCENFRLERDFEVENFYCKKGYFDYTDYGNRTEGEYKYWACEGKFFKLNASLGSLWSRIQEIKKKEAAKQRE